MADTTTEQQQRELADRLNRQDDRDRQIRGDTPTAGGIAREQESIDKRNQAIGLINAENQREAQAAPTFERSETARERQQRIDNLDQARQQVDDIGLEGASQAVDARERERNHDEALRREREGVLQGPTVSGRTLDEEVARRRQETAAETSKRNTAVAQTQPVASSGNKAAPKPSTTVAKAAPVSQKSSGNGATAKVQPVTTGLQPEALKTYISAKEKVASGDKLTSREKQALVTTDSDTALDYALYAVPVEKILSPVIKPVVGAAARAVGIAPKGGLEAAVRGTANALTAEVERGSSSEILATIRPHPEVKEAAQLGRAAGDAIARQDKLADEAVKAVHAAVRDTEKKAAGVKFLEQRLGVDVTDRELREAVEALSLSERQQLERAATKVIKYNDAVQTSGTALRQYGEALARAGKDTQGFSTTGASMEKHSIAYVKAVLESAGKKPLTAGQVQAVLDRAVVSKTERKVIHDAGADVARAASQGKSLVKKAGRGAPREPSYGGGGSEAANVGPRSGGGGPSGAEFEASAAKFREAANLTPYPERRESLLASARFYETQAAKLRPSGGTQATALAPGVEINKSALQAAVKQGQAELRQLAAEASKAQAKADVLAARRLNARNAYKGLLKSKAEARAAKPVLTKGMSQARATAKATPKITPPTKSAIAEARAAARKAAAEAKEGQVAAQHAAAARKAVAEAMELQSRALRITTTAKARQTLESPGVIERQSERPAQSTGTFGKVEDETGTVRQTRTDTQPDSQVNTQTDKRTNTEVDILIGNITDPSTKSKTDPVTSSDVQPLVQHRRTVDTPRATATTTETSAAAARTPPPEPKNRRERNDEPRRDRERGPRAPVRIPLARAENTPGRYARVVSWVQGAQHVDYDLDTNQRTFRPASESERGKTPRETFGVTAFDNTPPRRGLFDLGLFVVKVDERSVSFAERGINTKLFRTKKVSSPGIVTKQSSEAKPMKAKKLNDGTFQVKERKVSGRRTRNPFAGRSSLGRGFRDSTFSRGGM